MLTKDILTLFDSHYKASINFLNTAVKNDFYGIDQGPKNERLLRTITEKKITAAFESAKIYVVPKISTIQEDPDETIEPYLINNINLPSKCMYIVSDNALMNVNEVVGFIVRHDLVISFVQTNIQGKLYPMPLITYVNGEWIRGGTNDKWPTKTGIMLLNVIEEINSLQVIKVNGITDKTFFRARDKIFKKSKVKPLEYYTVSLQSRIISSSKNSSESQVERQYAYDVRGHNAYRILTGSIPIDPKIENYLKKDERRKIFYSSNELDDDSRELLLKRNIFIKENEWVSILKYWVEGYVANSKDGKNPYIPSIHVAT